jgi:hypothetical protein
MSLHQKENQKQTADKHKAPAEDAPRPFPKLYAVNEGNARKQRRNPRKQQ